MRRETLQPDEQGRVDLAQLGFEGEAVIADEIEPGRWMLMSEQTASGAAPDPARAQEPELADASDEETAPPPPPTAPTVAHGTSRPRIERPASRPPGGPSRRSRDSA